MELMYLRDEKTSFCGIFFKHLKTKSFYAGSLKCRSITVFENFRSSKKLFGPSKCF